MIYFDFAYRTKMAICPIPSKIEPDENREQFIQKLLHQSEEKKYLPSLFFSF